MPTRELSTSRSGATINRAWLLLTLLALSPFGSFASGGEGVLPPSGFEGWTLDGKPRTYAGDALYNHIDGGAEPFLELGFESCEVGRYKKGGAELTAECYRMSDAAAALGIYLMQCGKETPDPNLGERHTASPNQLTLVRGRFLLRLTGRPGACPKREVFLGFARRCVGRIPEAPPPSILSRATPEGAVEGSLRIVRGPVTLQALAPPFPPEAPSFGTGVTGVALDRSREGRTSTLLLIEYSDPAAASRAAADLGPRMPAGAAVEIAAEGSTLRVSWTSDGGGSAPGK